MSTATAVTIAGTAITLLSHVVVAVFVYGRLTERVKANSEKLNTQGASLIEQGERISTIEGRLTALACMPLPGIAKAAHR